MKTKLFLILLVVALIFSLFIFTSGKKGKAPLGSEENPIVWAFVPSGETERVSAGAEEVAKILHKMTGLYFKTTVATEYAGVIEALASDPPSAHMASLATFAYIVASAKHVAKVALVSVRYGSPTYTGQIIVRKDSGIKTLKDLKGKSFARPDPISTSGWIMPSLLLRAEGMNPDTDLKIVDAGSHDAVVAAVYNGDVDAGACYVDARTRLEKEHPDVMDVVVPIKLTPPIPNDGVQFHPSVPKDIREKIVNALLEMTKTEEGKKALKTAYQWDALERHDDTFYDPFRQLLQAAGVNPEDYLK